jgi:hypothetical protein
VTVEAVLSWFPRASESFREELDAWAWGYSLEGKPVSEVTAQDFPAWWDRFDRLAHGDMPTSMQTDIKVLFGEVALQVDIDNSTDGDDDACVGATACREALVEAGLAPGGMWRVWLLADQLEVALALADTWVELDPKEPDAAFRASLRAILDASDEIDRTTLSARAKRVATAISAMCSVHLETPEVTCERVERFFEFERQYLHEAGPPDPAVELTYIALAGVIAYANLDDLDGVQGVMRRIRHRVEDSGGSLPPRFMTIWAIGLRSLDAAFAQMIARQLLIDVTNANPSSLRGDPEFAAAFLLMETSALAGDTKLVEQLAKEWMPLAIRAPHGPGSQKWINAAQFSTDRTNREDDHDDDH